MNKLLVTVGAAVVAATCQAGIKYWDNQDYKAYDANDYVPGAVWNLDGIDNVGTGTHDSTATTWKNLGSSGANNDVWVRYQKSGGGWVNKAWHNGQTQYTYDEATANGKTIRLTWSAPLPGMKITIK